MPINETPLVFKVNLPKFSGVCFQILKNIVFQTAIVFFHPVKRSLQVIFSDLEQRLEDTAVNPRSRCLLHDLQDD